MNVSSVAGLGYGPHDSPEYAAAKAGLVRLTATLAPLAETHNIRVNCVVPHWIETDEVKRVIGLVEDDTLAGRILVMWCEEPPHLIDPGRRE